MTNITFTYTRNGLSFPQYINPEFFSKLVREKVEHEHFAEYEAIMVIVDQFISELCETPDEFTLEYTDDDGFEHTFFGNFKK